MATDVLPCDQGAHHDPETRETALAALVAVGGSPKAARDRLLTQGVDVPYSTLADWRHRYAERIAELHELAAPHLDAQLIQKTREIALQGFEAAALGIEKTHEALENGDLKDPAGATRNLATTAAIAADKMLVLTGRPTQITEHRNPDDVLAKLHERGILKAIDADAEEIPDAQEAGESRQLGEAQTVNAHPNLSST